MKRNKNNKGTEILRRIQAEDVRTPQKVCCTYCTLEPGKYHGAEITRMEGVQDRPFLTMPTGWTE